MYAQTLRKAQQIRHFTITVTEHAGWEVREEADSRLIRRDLYTDWHRVERAKAGFAETVHSLVDEGWVAVA